VQDYRATGECCTCCSQTFTLSDPNGVDVGDVKKNWSGLKKEFFTDADIFSMNFPPEAGATQRANLLGALFLIDFLYYEDNNNNN
jgi:Scramblase